MISLVVVVLLEIQISDFSHFLRFHSYDISFLRYHFVAVWEKIVSCLPVFERPSDDDVYAANLINDNQLTPKMFYCEKQNYR